MSHEKRFMFPQTHERCKIGRLVDVLEPGGWRLESRVRGFLRSRGALTRIYVTTEHLVRTDNKTRLIIYVGLSRNSSLPSAPTPSSPRRAAREANFPCSFIYNALRAGILSAPAPVRNFRGVYIGLCVPSAILNGISISPAVAKCYRRYNVIVVTALLLVLSAHRSYTLRRNRR